MKLQDINALSQAEFVALLGDIFEHSPWIARQAWEQRPLHSLDALHRAMVDAMMQAPHGRQIELMRAHPQLTGRIADPRTLTLASREEQASAGLDACTPEQKAELSQLNCKYFTRHGFPFITAVKGRSVCDILEEMKRRARRSAGEEFDDNLRQIARIARLRLEALIDDA